MKSIKLIKSFQFFGSMKLFIFIMTMAIFVSSGICRDIKSKSNQRKSLSMRRITLYPESYYDGEYLSEYKRMLGSLMPSSWPELSLSRRRGEKRTASELFGKFSNIFSDCTTTFKNSLKTVKVLQDEESNYVMLKEDQRDGKLYVEKSTRSKTSFDSEIEFFHRLDGNNSLVPKLICFMPTPGREERFSILTEFIRGRDSHILAGQATSQQLKEMVQQLFEAVVDLHRMGFIHADIKPGNVLVTDDFRVKLIDFGMTTRVGEAKKYRGSPYTRAPELHDKCPGGVDVGIDWWAFGSTVAIWYYYHYNHSKNNLKQNKVHLRTVDYFQIFSSYDFTPFKWSGSKFHSGIFPSLICLNKEGDNGVTITLTGTTEGIK